MLISSSSEFDLIKIGLASPERIRFWSYGEVEKPETINYRTFRPERKGLFCEKIFGPVKDWECACGKYRRVRYRGIVCERCGVEVTHSKVRRERMGCIELASAVSHIWYLKGIPSYMGLILNMSSRALEQVIYYDSFIVVNVKGDDAAAVLSENQLLSDKEYAEYKARFGDQFDAEMGASAVKQLLQKIDIKDLVEELRESVVTTSGQKKLKATKRLRAAEAFYSSGNKPDWMILDVIPVIPPDLRPMVQLEGGRFATSDLNDLYRRVVNRNNRLKRLIDIGAPGMIIRNEKRMLQEAVDVLIDNGRIGRAVTGSNGRPLKSLTDIIEGKQGRFRQNLLGKRVDYSGRSVIVVGPHLKLHQCGVPKEMALELFKPFIIHKLVENGFVQNVKSAKRKIDAKEVVVYDVLEEVIQGHPVLLNRAPTLHRLGIQAFEPVLVEGKAIQIHPLVCTAFNADFDGDQMAIHVPLSMEAQAEARLLMLAPLNLLSPSNGAPIVTPSQDMVLGCYYLTFDNVESTLGKGKIFANPAEAIRAYDIGVLGLQSEIKMRVKRGTFIETTVGRTIFNSTLSTVIQEMGHPPIPFINRTIGKKQLSHLIAEWYDKYGQTIVSKLVDVLKDMGFTYSTRAGISIAIEDLVRVPEKKAILLRAEKEEESIDKLHKKGSITTRERREKIHEVWRSATTSVTDAMAGQLGLLNNVYIMANSGARGSMDQVRQLAGMRGLMADATGNIVDIPIKSNFREGLSITEYFISSYGARKGLVDTALRTADSGYLTRRLVDVAQDVVVTEADCGTTEGIELRSIEEGVETILSLSNRLIGRVSLEDIVDPETKEKFIKKDEEISDAAAKRAGEIGVECVRVRSVLMCNAGRGFCQKCYGRDLSRHALINIGEAVGIISAQSIGEPGTQLTMRTFHTGGVDLRKAAKVEIKAKAIGVIKFGDEIYPRKAKDEYSQVVDIATREGNIYVESAGATRHERIPAGAILRVKHGQKIKAGELIAEYNSTVEYVITGSAGKLKYIGIEYDTTKNTAGKDGEVFVFNPEIKHDYEVPKDAKILVKVDDRVKVGTEIADGISDTIAGVIEEIKTTKGKTVISICPGEATSILAGATMLVLDGAIVEANDVIARESVASSSKASDIVSGLPRVEELFEVRKPKNSALLSEIDGVVEISEKEGAKQICVTDETGSKEYVVPYGVRIKVFSGKQIKKGDQLTDGVINPHDLLATKGLVAVQTYIVDEVQIVYRSQGVTINDKHIETIVRQMTKKIKVDEMGETSLLPGEILDRYVFEQINQEAVSEGKKTATGERVLLGITKASLSTDSFISAASFQETSKVLTEAAVKGKIDKMYGLKENVIIGKLIPVGTGLPDYRSIELSAPNGESLVPEILEEDLEQ